MRTKICSYAVISAMVGLFSSTLVASVSAAPNQVTLKPLTAGYQIDLRSQPRQTLTFPVVSGNELTINVHSASDALTLKLRLPNGTVVDKQNASQSGVSFEVFNPTTAEEEIFVSPTAMQLIKVQNPSPGSYELQAEGAVTTIVPVQVTTVGSGLRTGIIIGKGEFEVTLGQKVTIAVVVFEQSRPLTNATVQGKVFRIVNDSLVEEVSLSFVDNGQGSDARANDGLYSVSYEPAQTGGYLITANLQGTNSQGLPFEANEGGRLVVNLPDIKLNGVFHDQGVDEDGDGYFDLVKFLFEADGPRGEGTYHMHLYLQASNGNKVDAVGRVSDPVAPLSVNFPAKELKELGTDGPYRLTFVNLAHDERYLNYLENLGDSKAYRLETMERENTLLRPLNADRGVDVDGDGLFDWLEVIFGVDVLISGYYGISATLDLPNQPRNTDLDNTGLTSVYLPRGNHNITLAFSGEKIGRSGQNGPYVLNGVLVYPRFQTRASAWAKQLGTTQPYSYSQFVGSGPGDPKTLLGRLLKQLDALNLNRGLKNSLRVKLLGTQAALEKDKTSADHKIRAFVNEVVAQREKTIPPAEADLLINGGMILVGLLSP
ncbi:MAG: hypothetical protein BWK78_03925 [Thiotrichaceae bacterium IS1]|nr:MAG: hypothetical protein BWK78_03925 [Thiotrichaceae bacterium IS1]